MMCPIDSRNLQDLGKMFPGCAIYIKEQFLGRGDTGLVPVDWNGSTIVLEYARERTGPNLLRIKR